MSPELTILEPHAGLKFHVPPEPECSQAENGLDWAQGPLNPASVSLNERSMGAGSQDEQGPSLGAPPLVSRCQGPRRVEEGPSPRAFPASVASQPLEFGPLASETVRRESSVIFSRLPCSKLLQQP